MERSPPPPPPEAVEGSPRPGPAPVTPPASCTHTPRGPAEGAKVEGLPAPVLSRGWIWATSPAWPGRQAGLWPPPCSRGPLCPCHPCAAGVAQSSPGGPGAGPPGPAQASPRPHSTCVLITRYPDAGAGAGPGDSPSPLSRTPSGSAQPAHTGASAQHSGSGGLRQGLSCIPWPGGLSKSLV